MTSKAAFTEQEWDVVRSAPPAAGMIVITASRGGTVRETFEMAKVYADVRSEHGESELLDELVSSKPEVDRSGQHSLEELKQHGLQRIGEAVELLERKATPEEVEDFRRFVTTLSERVARRHKEDGVEVSAAEQQAIDDVGTALGSPRA
jgi:hypothetical protein